MQKLFSYSALNSKGNPILTTLAENPDEARIKLSMTARRTHKINGKKLSLLNQWRKGKFRIRENESRLEVEGKNETLIALKAVGQSILSVKLI